MGLLRRSEGVFGFEISDTVEALRVSEMLTVRLCDTYKVGPNESLQLFKQQWITR